MFYFILKSKVFAILKLTTTFNFTCKSQTWSRAYFSFGIKPETHRNTNKIGGKKTIKA